MLMGGTHFQIVLTSHEFPTCGWSSATKYQFLAAGGATVGSWHTAPSTATLTAVGDTFQVVQNLATMEGVQCTSKVASSIAVISPNGAKVAVALSRPQGVCVNGTTQWSTLSPTAFPKPPACSMLTVSVGQSNGAAGTIYYPLVLLNPTSAACTISGIPTVQPTSRRTSGSSYSPVGPAARKLNLSAQGLGNPVRLAPNASASVAFGVSETGNYTPSDCVAKAAKSVTLSIGAVHGIWTPMSISVCTKLASTSVSGVSPTTTGEAP